MRRYLAEPASDSSISIAPEFGAVDMVRILNGVRESVTPQYFGLRKGGSIISDFELIGGMLCFGACDGNFYALEPETGRELWRYAAGDVILSFAAGDDAMYISCYDHNLHAIDFDGRLLWKFKADGKLGNVSCNKGRVYFGTESGSLYCVGSDGDLAWRFSTDSLIAAKPKVHGNLVLFGDFHGRFYALDNGTGRLKWRFTAAGGGIGSCVVADNVIYFPTRKNIFYALNTEGKELWRHVFSQGLCVEMNYEPPEGLVFACGLENSMYAISTKIRKIVWEFRTQEIVNTLFAIDGGLIYVGDCDDRFHAIDIRNGNGVWSFKTNGINISGVVVHNGKVYFGSWDCNAYCLDTKTGRLIWKFRTSMSQMSDYEIDRRADNEEITFTLTVSEEQTVHEKKEDDTAKDYGELSGNYMTKENMDYVSSGRKGYIRKSGF